MLLLTDISFFFFLLETQFAVVEEILNEFL